MIGEFLETVFQNTGARAEALRVRIQNWTPAAFRVLTRLLWQILLWSLIVLVVALLVSAGLETKPFLAWVGVAYLLLLILILRGRGTLHAAGLLLGVDASIDIFRGLTPLSAEKLKNVAKLNFDMSRLKELATLQLVGRMVFSVVLFELIVLFTFSLVPIWTRPGLAGHLVLGGILYGFLSTQWGRSSPFGKLAPVVGAITIFIILLFGWDELKGYYQTLAGGQLWSTGWTGLLGSLFWLTILAGALFFALRAIWPSRASSGEHGGGNGRGGSIFAALALIVFGLLLGPWLTRQPGAPQIKTQEQVLAESTAPSGPALTYFRFWNNRKDPVRVYWVESDGGEKLKGTVPSGMKWQQPSYPDNRWVIRNGNGAELWRSDGITPLMEFSIN